MLKKLTIKNFALIDYAEIIFTENFNVLSGETGAGKSIVLDSLNFVLGAKADKNQIRSLESECLVTAEFDLSSASWAEDLYNELDYDFDDTLIISRKFNVSGKNSIKINGNPANVSILKRFTSYLVDVHGQSEHFSLLSSSNQLALLDKFAGEKLFNLKKDIANILSDYKEVKSEIETLGGEESSRLIRLDVLTYQINEIEKADIKEGEEENLISIRDRLKYQEKIVNSLSSIKYSLSNEGGVSDITSGAVKEASYISGFGEEYSSLYDRLSSVYSEIDDIISSADSMLESFEYSEYNPEEIEDRLDLIKKIKKKYGDSFEEIITFLDNAIKEKDKLENFSILFEELLTKEKALKENLYSKYQELREIRLKTAKTLSNNVVVELKELGMKDAKFDVEFSNIPSFEECKFDGVGFDSIQFLFSANLGEPLRPLSTVISGGEMSRFMLALKVQTSKCNEISTFVFDEIDAGISGIVANTVGEKLCKISKNVQVICISHLPQIVAFGDNNLLINKVTENNNTFTRIKHLSIDGKIDEISRLIGGDANSKSAKDHSVSIIEKANLYKKSI